MKRKPLIILFSFLLGVLFVLGFIKWFFSLNFEGEVTITILTSSEKPFLTVETVEKLLQTLIHQPDIHTNGKIQIEKTTQQNIPLLPNFILAKDSAFILDSSFTVTNQVNSNSDSSLNGNLIDSNFIRSRQSGIKRDTGSPFLILDTGFEVKNYTSNIEEINENKVEESDSPNNTIANIKIKSKSITIENYLDDTQYDSLKANDFKNINVLEQSLADYPFIERVQISKDLMNTISISVYEKKPLARIITSKGINAYIVNGAVVSEKIASYYLPRILVITGQGVDKLIEPSFWQSSKGQSFYKLLSAIESDEFLSLMLGQITINKDLYLKFYPQLGKQVLHFGYLENLDKKINKIHLLYNQIIPKKGWKQYKNIILYCDNKIICR